MKPLKVLTAAQMREIDRRTTELGIPSLILMENAAFRVIEFLETRFRPLGHQRILVFCGKGNNGGDGLAIARQLHIGDRARTLQILLACPPEELAGDAAANYRMLQASGAAVKFEIEPPMQAATLIIDALIGSGLNGPARGKALEWIQAINTGFPLARVVAVDVPSGMPSDSGDPAHPFARADATITFTAPRHCHVLAPNCRHLGELHVAQIGTAESVYQDNPDLNLAVTGSRVFADLLAPRDSGGNKGSYGHVLVVAGSRGKTGAAAMSGMAALHAGAGLVTVASARSAIPVIANYAPELMTEFLDETPDGSIAAPALAQISALMQKRTLLALGPGLGTANETGAVVKSLFADCDKPMVVDADALNILAEALEHVVWPAAGNGRLRVLTPHPGEMARLTQSSVKSVQADRIGSARRFAAERRVILVLKGERTLLAFPDGEVWINPTGSPAMATGGTGDVLTGMIAGFLAQFPTHPAEAVAAAVWLHGRAGEIGAAKIGELPFVATDLLRLLPDALREARNGGTHQDYSNLF